MRNLALLTLALLFAPHGLHAATPDNTRRYLNNREILLTLRTGAGDFDRIVVYASRDHARSWQPVNVQRVGPRSVIYHAPADGDFDLYVVLENLVGRSATPPGPDATPHASFTVDTNAPLAQIRAVEPVWHADAPCLRLALSAIDDHLGDAARRLFYRPTGTSRWIDGGLLKTTRGQALWPIPAAAPATLDLRLVVTDLAGNHTFHDFPEVTARPPQPPAAPTTAPPTAPPSNPQPAAPQATSPTITLATANQTPESPHRLTPAQRERLHRYRERAAEHLKAGRYDLAAARLKDAVELYPENPDLLVELANTLLRLDNLDGARQQFSAARDADNNHLGALDGLALVASLQNRYPEARDQLKQLLELQPDSSRHWLRYGDIVHRLGESNAARDAWRQALELPSADGLIREKALRRLDYFGSRPTR